MSALKHFELITIEQYEALPEDAHTEVFEGIPYNMASPSQEHQTISMELSTTINNYMKKRQGSPTRSDGHLQSRQTRWKTL